MSQGRYVWIAGKKVYLNPELQKEWDKLINKERYRACQEKNLRTGGLPSLQWGLLRVSMAQGRNCCFV